MAELVSAIATYAVWLYLLLGLLMFRELRSMWRAGYDRDRALFGLEREAAASRAVRSLVTLFLLVTIASGVYTIATVIAPTLPAAQREQLAQPPLLEPPPPIPLAADTPTPAATATARLPRIVTATPTPATGLAPTPLPELCRNPDVQIDAPGAGTVLEAPQPVVVTVRFRPAAGRRFRLRLGAGEAPTIWLPVGQDHAEPVTGGAVETLSPAGLATGSYSLRLELAEADDSVAPGNRCTLAVRVP